MREPNIYHPLNSLGGDFRLFQIQPVTKFSAPIVCKLRHVYLSNDPSTSACLTYGAMRRAAAISTSKRGLFAHVKIARLLFDD
jgi:hypothetical protein